MGTTTTDSLFTLVKRSLRWSHDSLDGEIRDNIRAAQDELIRVGVDETAARGRSPLIIRAIKTYCKGCFADDPETADRFMAAFNVQADGLRKSHGYNTAPEVTDNGV